MLEAAAVPVRSPAPRRRARRVAPAKAAQPRDTRQEVFLAAARLFSARGFDGVGVDEIARDAGVNKAMIYYHFTDKLALYRAIVGEMLRDAGVHMAAIAASAAPADQRLDQFIESFVDLREQREWLPALMLREMAEGAPHLDLETLGAMRTVFEAFGRIIADGHAQGLFRPVNPILGYLSVIAPLLLDAARERTAAQPGRAKLPMFAKVSRAELVTHVRQAARRMLAKD